MRFAVSIELENLKLMILNKIFRVYFVTNPPNKDGANTKSKGHNTSKSHNPLI
jgi:hypothetical protein